MDSRGIIQGKPTEIHSFWYGFPTSADHVDAVYERKTDGKIIFFIGMYYEKRISFFEVYLWRCNDALKSRLWSFLIVFVFIIQ